MKANIQPGPDSDHMTVRRTNMAALNFFTGPWERSQDWELPTRATSYRRSSGLSRGWSCRSAPGGPPPSWTCPGSPSSCPARSSAWTTSAAAAWTAGWRAAGSASCRGGGGTSHVFTWHLHMYSSSPQAEPWKTLMIFIGLDGKQIPPHSLLTQLLFIYSKLKTAYHSLSTTLIVKTGSETGPKQTKTLWTTT